MKRLIASLALGGSLLGGGIVMPLMLTAQSAYAAPVNPHSKENASPNLPPKAQQALILNGEWDQVAAGSCRIVITPSGSLICV